MVIQSGASYGWRNPEKDQAAYQLGIRFGYDAAGDLYYPTAAEPDAKLPVVIWLHGYGYAMGYEWSYRRDLSPILALVKAGYAVFAFDQVGFGSRIAEAGRFYDRYPHWSQLGRMVEDTRAAVDMLQKNPKIDPEKIYLFGYSLGGTLGIYTAALDSRVKGVVSICGFTPMRTDAADRGDGGIARYSHIHGLLPRLGFFIGEESRIPYDYQELLGAIAPRPGFRPPTPIRSRRRARRRSRRSGERPQGLFPIQRRRQTPPRRALGLQPPPRIDPNPHHRLDAKKHEIKPASLQTAGGFAIIPQNVVHLVPTPCLAIRSILQSIHVKHQDVPAFLILTRMRPRLNRKVSHCQVIQDRLIGYG